MKIPRAGEQRTLAKSFGRELREQDFFHPDSQEPTGERKEVYSLWHYGKGSPAIIFPLTMDHEVVAVRQFRHGANACIMEIPGGIPKGNQTAIEAAEMELLEETGFRAGTIIDLERNSWVDSAAHNLRIQSFVGIDCVKVREPTLDRTEVMETVIIPIAQWFEMIRTGQIDDFRIIAISFLAVQHIKAIALIPLL